MVDEKGWQETAELLEATLEGIFSIQAKSAGRRVEQGGPDDSVLATISLLSFESPGPDGSQ